MNEQVRKQGDIEVTESLYTVNGEALLMAVASKPFSKQELRSFSLYSTIEPCAMCSRPLSEVEAMTISVYAGYGL